LGGGVVVVFVAGVHGEAEDHHSEWDEDEADGARGFAHFSVLVPSDAEEYIIGAGMLLEMRGMFITV
jgi:hypothetical protein